MTKFAWISVAAALVAGCATQAKFSAHMDSLVGQPEIAVVSRLGAPERSHVLTDGHRVLQWRHSRTTNLTMPGGTTPVTTYTQGTATLNQGGQFGTAGYQQQSTTYVPNPATVIPIHQACTLNVTIDPKGIIKAWSASGNDCKSR